MALQTKTLIANGAKGHHKFTLTVTENSTSVAGNTSNLSWALVISPVVKDFDWESNSGKVKWSVTINGNTYSGSIAKYDGVSTVTIKSSTLSCAHNADGTKTISYSFSITDSTGWSFAPGNASASGTMALTAIPRQATITVAPNFNDEENPKITYANPAGSAVTSLDLCISLDEKITNALSYKAVSETGTSYTYTLTSADRKFLQNATPNSNTLKVWFCLRTVIGENTYYSKVQKTLSIIDADPTLNPTITDANTTIANLTGGKALVRYYSNAKFTSGAAAQKGATIKSQSVTCGGVTIEAGSGTFTGVKSGDFVFTVTDSRGNITTQTVKKDFVNYVKLTCSIGNNKPDTDGNFTLKASGKCFKGTITGAGTNTVTVSYRYKVSGGSYSGWKAMTVTLGSNAYTATASLTGLDYRKTYIFQCKAVDLVASATTDEVAIKTMPVFDWGENDFRFNVPVKLPEGPLADYVIETGTESMGDSGTWYWTKWASGRAECYGYSNYGDVEITNPWGALYESAAYQQALPTDLFVSAPTTTIQLVATESGAGWVVIQGNSGATESKTGKFTLCRPTSFTMLGARIGFVCKGRWK